jgi:hypothetical protein
MAIYEDFTAGKGRFTKSVIIDGNLSVAGTITPQVASAVDIVGDFSVATNKLTVAAATGNTAVAGTLAVTGTSTLTGVVTHSGASHLVGAVTADAALSVGTTFTATGAATHSSTSHFVGAVTLDAALKLSNGGTVTQITTIATGVTLNKNTGQIVTVSTTLAAGVSASFVVTNSAVIDAKAVVVACVGTTSSAGTPTAHVSNVAAGAFTVTLRNAHASDALNNTVTINFAVLGGA